MNNNEARKIEKSSLVQSFTAAAAILGGFAGYELPNQFMAGGYQQIMVGSMGMILGALAGAGIGQYAGVVWEHGLSKANEFMAFWVSDRSDKRNDDPPAPRP